MKRGYLNNVKKVICGISILFAILIIGGLAEAKQIKWVEDSFEDFKDGELDAGGENIFVSDKGQIRTIHRFDVNQDGFLDLFFGNTHDYGNVIAPTVCQVTPQGTLEQRPLSVPGSNHVRSGDFDHDGVDDLAFSLESDGSQGSRRFLSIVYGTEKGWSGRTVNSQLAAESPLDIAVTDLNADGWEDITTINSSMSRFSTDKGGKAGNIWIYWGGENGFSYNRIFKIDVPKAKAFAAGDFDKDKASDLAILTSDGDLIIYWAKAAAEPNHFENSKISFEGQSSKGKCITAADINKDGMDDLVIGTDSNDLWIVYGQESREGHKATAFAGFPSSHISIGDLDGDGYKDLVLTYSSLARAGGGEVTGAGEGNNKQLCILWGDSKGFSRENCTELEAPYASATAIGDLDADGKADIAAAVLQEESSFTANSLIYKGIGKRQFQLLEQKIKTYGATDVVIVSAKKELPARAVFANSMDGTPFELIPTFLYWGSAKGFSKTNKWVIPAQSCHSANAADLNGDGFVDLIVMNTAHGGAKKKPSGLMGINIWWQDAKGFDINRRTVLDEKFMDSCNIADLNRDGFLDIVAGGFGEPGDLSIYYGSAKGFGEKQTFESRGRSEGPVIADFNKDAWLDIAVTSFDKDVVRIFWGGQNGFDISRQEQLTMAAPIGIQSADLNGDGYLDIVAASYYDRNAGFMDLGNLIFWGSKEGFHNRDAQSLPGLCTLFQNIADFDGDGYLDIFCPNYHDLTRRESIPSYLYWGGKDGFHPQKRTVFLCNSASSGCAGDFDRDGKIDLAITNHTVFGNHKTDSKVFYNDGNRFFNSRIEYVPTVGAHFMWIQDMGHIYDRKHQQKYVSSLFAWDRPARRGSLSFKADVPKGTKLQFMVRSSDDKESISAQPWRTVSSKRFSLESSDRFLQYQAILLSSNGDLYPVLDRVEINLAE